MKRIAVKNPRVAPLYCLYWHVRRSCSDALTQCNLHLMFKFLTVRKLQYQVHKERHTCSPETAMNKTSSWGWSVLMLKIIETFLKAEYCEMVNVNAMQVSFHIKPMMLCNFVNHFFPISFVFVIGMSTQQCIT